MTIDWNTKHEIARRPSDPPFFRGAKGEWDAPYCDRILDCGDACDDTPAYLVEWKPTERDLGTLPVSGCCEDHAPDVDRALVVRIHTHEVAPRA